MKDWLLKFQDCSRCMGLILAVFVVVIAAFALADEPRARILEGGMKLAEALCLVGVGAYARGKGIDPPAGGSPAISDPNPAR